MREISGEGQEGEQFQIGPIASIYCDAGTTFTYETNVLNGCVFVGSNVYVHDLYVNGSNGAAIYVVRNRSLIRMYNIASGTQYGQPNSVPFKADSTEWMWIEHFNFGVQYAGSYPASMWFTSTTDNFDACGLCYLRDGVLGFGGIRIDGGSIPTPNASQIYLDNIETETIDDALITVDPSHTFLTDTWLRHVGMADAGLNGGTMTGSGSLSVGATSFPVLGDSSGHLGVNNYYTVPISSIYPLYFQLSGGGDTENLACTGLTAGSLAPQNVGTPGTLTCNPLDKNGNITANGTAYAYTNWTITPQPRLIRSLNPSRDSRITDIHIEEQTNCGNPVADFPILGLTVKGYCDGAGPSTDDVRHGQRNYSIEAGGVTDSERMAEGANALNFAPFQSLNVPQSPSSWTVGGGTLSSGVTDPWGGTNAGTISCGASPCWATVYNSNSVAANVGDWACFVSWARSETPGHPFTDSAGQNATALTLLGTGASFDRGANFLAPSGVFDQGLSEGRWSRFRTCGKVTGAGTGYQLTLGANSNISISYAKPSIIVIPVTSGLSDAEITRLLRNIGGYVSNLPAATGPRLMTFPETSLCWGASCIAQSNGMFTVPALNVTGALTQNGAPVSAGYIRTPLQFTIGCASFPCTVSPASETQEVYASIPASYNLSSTAVIRVSALVSCSATATQKTARIRIGQSSLTGLAVAQASNNTANASNNDLLVEGEMYWTGPATQTSRNHSNSGGSAVNSASSMAWFHYADGATTYSVPLIAELTIQTNGTDACTIRTFAVEVYP